MESDFQHAAENLVFRNIQTALKEIREKWTRASGLLRDLKAKNEELGMRNLELEELVEKLQAELAEGSRGADKGSRESIDVPGELLYFSADEREALERQIAELLERVETHLK